MMLKKIAAASLLALVLIFSSALAQDRQYAKDIIAKLASPQLHGRGYIKKGDSKAAHFIAREFKKDGLESFGKNYYQYYHMPMNTHARQARHRCR